MSVFSTAAVTRARGGPSKHSAPLSVERHAGMRARTSGPRRNRSRSPGRSLRELRLTEALSVPENHLTVRRHRRLLQQEVERVARALAERLQVTL
jgi:hypothetical protein